MASAIAATWIVLFSGTPDALVQESLAQESVAAATSAVPSVTLINPSGLPSPLSAQDASLYRAIFALQAKGKMAEADQRIRQLTDKGLMGHVLAQRYLHPTAYRSKYEELRDWMANYADHPDAKRIYKLALKRRPKNYKYPQRPAARGAGIPPAAAVDRPYRSSKRLSKADRRRAARIKRQIRRNVLSTRLTVTEELLTEENTKRLLDQVEIDQGYAKVAAAWFYYGKNDKAYSLAGGAAKRSGKLVPLAHWTAGLAAWRLGRIQEAATHFEQLALSDKSSDWNTAAGAYWAARSHLRLRNPEQMSQWLARAAKNPRTFYGLLAHRALGLKLRFETHAHTLDPSLLAKLEATPASNRALRLLQLDERRIAARELEGLDRWADPDMTQALLALAEQAQMPELAFKMGQRLAAAQQPEITPGTSNGVLDAALYPIPPWQPAKGFIVDRALVYALVRQESGFNPNAKSPDGARGLMQLMPNTASFIARDRGYRRGKREQLFDPATNLDLGQRYIAHLLQNELVRGDLFRLTTAYNGGPGNLNKWQRNMDYKNDPLLFIESLPSLETRLFVERVLTNLWIYRTRLGQRTPSLDGIASGDWPLYVSLDSKTPKLAQFQ